MGVARNEVDWAPRQRVGIEAPLAGCARALFDGVPPALCSLAIVRARAGQQINEQLHLILADLLQAFGQARSPGARQFLHILAADLQDLLQRLLLHTAQRLALHVMLLDGLQEHRITQAHVHLVPFDLEGGQDGNQVVNVRDAGDEAGQGLIVVIEHAPPPRRRAHQAPGLDRAITTAGEDFFRLAEEHVAHVHDLRRQAQPGVEKRRDVWLQVSRFEMQAGIHADVRLFQGAHADGAAAAQQRIVGAQIKLDAFTRGKWHCAIHAVNPFFRPRGLWRLRGTRSCRVLSEPR